MFNVWGLRSKIKGLGYRRVEKDSGFRIYVQCFEFRIWVRTLTLVELVRDEEEDERLLAHGGQVVEEGHSQQHGQLHLHQEAAHSGDSLASCALVFRVAPLTSSISPRPRAEFTDDLVSCSPRERTSERVKTERVRGR